MTEEVLRGHDHWCDKHDLPEEYVVNPFMYEVYQEIVWQWLCDKCQEEKRDDI